MHRHEPTPIATCRFRLARANSQVVLNPPRDQTWRLVEDDQVIVLAQQIYQ